MGQTCQQGSAFCTFLNGNLMQVLIDQDPSMISPNISWCSCLWRCRESTNFLIALLKVCGVLWTRGLVHQSQAPVLWAAECGFESKLWYLCPWAWHYNHNCFVQSWEGIDSALPDRPLVDNTLAYILTDSEGANPVSAPGVYVGGNMPLVAVDFGRFWPSMAFWC